MKKQVVFRLPLARFHQRFALASFVLLLCLAGSCKQGRSPVSLPDDATPGRRDYLWTVDTLKLGPQEFSYPAAIWGSAPDNVWLAFNGSPSMLWHYDGLHWKKDLPQKALQPTAMWGFGGSDIWQADVDYGFWHYDGVQWSVPFKPEPPAGFQRTDFAELWGSTPFDLWAVGFADLATDGGNGYVGLVMHYDGFQWRTMPIPALRIGFLSIRGEFGAKEYFLRGTCYSEHGDTCMVFRYDGKARLKQVYASLERIEMFSMAGQIYFIDVGSHAILKYSEQTGFYRWKDFSAAGYMGWLVGRNEMDFFGISDSNDIMHYNGTDFVVVYKNLLFVWNGFLVGDSVFFVCMDVNRMLVTVIRGRLASQSQ